MSFADRLKRRGVRRALVLGLVACGAGGCWLDPTTDPPPFDCAAIDRADERFPEECGDAGAADADVDADVDAGP